MRFAGNDVAQARRRRKDQQQQSQQSGIGLEQGEELDTRRKAGKKTVKSRKRAIGIAGGMFAAMQTFVSPESFVLNESIMILAMVVLGGMGSFLGAVIGGLIVGLTESFGGLYLGESLGQIGIFAIFIAVLLLRPQGLFGARH
jgi:hypothetical protein